jgi:hypothetical protein
LRNSPHFEEIIRMSLRTVKWWREVKIPLCSKDGNRVQISLSDIWPQKIGRKEKLNPINALTWYQIIEAAFTKSHPRTYGEIDRKATNGGRMDEAIMLLLWNNHIISNKYGSTTEVAWETSKWIEIFENYNPWTDMLFLVGEPTSLKVTKKYNIISWWNRSESGYNHAYTIDNIDIINRTVIVVNPRDTSQKTKLTYDEIIKSFWNIQTVKTNYASLFANYL